LAGAFSFDETEGYYDKPTVKVNITQMRLPMGIFHLSLFDWSLQYGQVTLLPR